MCLQLLLLKVCASFLFRQSKITCSILWSARAFFEVQLVFHKWLCAILMRENVTTQKMNFSIMCFLSKCIQIHRKLRRSHIYWRNSQWKISFFAQFVSFFWKKGVWNIGRVFLYFVADTKIILCSNFGALLTR